MKKGAWISMVLIAVAYVIFQEVRIFKLARQDHHPEPQSPSALAPERIRAATWLDFDRHWRKVDGQMDESRQLRRRAVLAFLKPEELVAGIKELLEGGYAIADEGILWSMLGFLAEDDPEAALRLSTGIPEQHSFKVRNLQLNLFKTLSSQDYLAARDWLDQQIDNDAFAAKQLDVLNTPRFKFEKVLFANLLTSNPDIARERMNELSEDERGRVFSNDYEHWLIDGVIPGEFIDFAREILPEIDSPYIVGETLAAQEVKSVTEAGKLLDEHDLTNAERLITAESLLTNHLALKAGPYDLLEIQNWVEDGFPDQADRILTAVFNQQVSRGVSTEDVIGGVFALADRSNDQAFLDYYLARRDGVIGDGLQSEI